MLERVNALCLVSSNGENIERSRMSSESRMRASMTARREVWLVRGVEREQKIEEQEVAHEISWVASYTPSRWSEPSQLSIQ